MKGAIRLISFASLALLMCYASSADAARRTSMAGNVLIEDKDDIFTFPQLILDYRNLIAFDYGVSSSEGSGVLLFGSEQMAFGIAVHRAEVTDGSITFGHLWDGELTGLSGPGDPWGGAVSGVPAPYTIFDFLFSAKVGTGAFGARLSIGNSSDSSEPAEGDGSSAGQTNIFLDLGYSMKGDFRLDLALGFAINMLSVVAAGEDVNSGTIIGIGLAGRGYSKMADRIDLGFIADIGFQSQSLETIMGDTSSTASNSRFSILAGVGPVYHVTDGTTVAGYITLGFATESEDPSDQVEEDGSSSNFITLPGFRIACEIELAEWFYFRSGVDYYYAFLSSSPEAGGSQGTRSHTFGWAAGMGIKLDEFRLDGSFSHEWLTAGPQFLGEGGHMFGIVSASYHY